jgi:hypothetical protein
MHEATEDSLVLDDMVSVDVVEAESVTKSATMRFKGIRLSFLQTLESILKKAIKLRFTENGNENDDDNHSSSRQSNYSNSMKSSFRSESTKHGRSSQKIEESHSGVNCEYIEDLSVIDVDNEIIKRTCCTLS